MDTEQINNLFNAISYVKSINDDLQSQTLINYKNKSTTSNQNVLTLQSKLNDAVKKFIPLLIPIFHSDIVNSLNYVIIDKQQFLNSLDKLNELKKLLESKGFSHPDDMSNYIIEKCIKHFKNTENER